MIAEGAFNLDGSQPLAVVHSGEQRFDDLLGLFLGQVLQEAVKDVLAGHGAVDLGLFVVVLQLSEVNDPITARVRGFAVYLKHRFLGLEDHKRECSAGGAFRTIEWDLLEAANVSKHYPTAQGPLPILSGVNLALARGESAAIMGPSGSGKSTLLYILGALEPPSEGAVTLDGRNPYALGERELAAFRSRNVGFLFQDHYLLPQCTVFENVLAPTLVARDGANYEQRARELLDAVGLSARLHHRPGELSGGERQRAALARALIREPRLLLCDEPTGNLDRKSAQTVAELLLTLHARLNTILIVVTHSAGLAARFEQRFELLDRRLERR